MKNIPKWVMLVIAVVVAILVLGGLAWYLMLPLLRTDGQPTVNLNNPNLLTGPVNEEQLKAAKTILDSLWENHRASNGLYALALECDGSCEMSMSTTNHPILIWARHSYVQATGDQNELERLKADIDSFYATFLDPNMPYRTAAFGCTSLNIVREESTYLPEDYKERLLQLCQRSVLSADANSYYGMTFGLAGGIEEAQLNELLGRLLEPVTGSSVNEKVANYRTRAIELATLLPDPDSPALQSENCVSPNRPIVGNLCDGSSQRTAINRIYDERYAYLVNNQIAKDRLGLQPSFLNEMPAQPSLEIETRGLLADGLMYYFMHNDAEEFALGKKCLLKQGLRDYTRYGSNQVLNRRIAEFIRPENYEFFGELLDENDQYVTSLWECAMADTDQAPEIFGRSLNKAWENWQSTPEYQASGLFTQPSLVRNGTEIPTITNSIIAGTLARANQR